jgi:hypothetical protein
MIMSETQPESANVDREESIRQGETERHSSQEESDWQTMWQRDIVRAKKSNFKYDFRPSRQTMEAYIEDYGEFLPDDVCSFVANELSDPSSEYFKD